MKGKNIIVGNRKIWHTPDGYFDLENPANDDMEGICFYHPRKNVIPTKRFMALVEGLEDYALVDLLAKQIPAGSPYAELISSSTLAQLIQQEDQVAVESWREKMLDVILATRKNQ